MVGPPVVTEAALVVVAWGASPSEGFFEALHAISASVVQREVSDQASFMD